MRLATHFLNFALATAASIAGISSAEAQISVEPIVGWTWEGQYSRWRVTGPNGHSNVDVNLSPALTVGARLSVHSRAMRFAMSYSQSHPDVAIDYDLLITGENFSLASFDTRTIRGSNRRFALEFAYARQTLPLSLELGGSLFVRTLSVERILPSPISSERRSYDNPGVSYFMSAGPESGRWGAPRVAVEVGEIRASGRVGIDFLELQTSHERGPHWAPFVMLSAGWRIDF